LRRPTLRSQLNQIRLWLRQGRTEAWIAHKLDISVATLEQFKRDHRLGAEPPAPESAAPEPAEPPAPTSSDLLAPEELEEEEELDREPEAVGAALDSSELPAPPGADGDSESDAGMPGTEAAVTETEAVGIGPEVTGSEDAGAVEAEETAEGESEEEEEEEEEEEAGRRRRRRRGRRGGRRRGAKPEQYEATFDHGEEVYALRLDPAVADNPVYEKHWAGHRTVAVILEPDAITIRRVETEDEPRE
jgi:hypothetical protein